MCVRLKTKILAVLATILLLWAGPCFAQEIDACLVNPACQKTTDEARKLSQAGQYDAALVMYQTAYGRSPVPWLLFNIGRMQQKLDRTEQARSSYQRFLQLSQTQEDASLREKAKAYLLEIEREQQRKQSILTPSSPKESPPVSTMPPTPMYKKWWLWTVVGVVAAGATATAIGLSVATRTPDTSGWPVSQPFGP